MLLALPVVASPGGGGVVANRLHVTPCMTPWGRLALSTDSLPYFILGVCCCR